MERDTLGYGPGRANIFIRVVILIMGIFIIAYATRYFLPEVRKWMKGGDPDTLQWSHEQVKR